MTDVNDIVAARIAEAARRREAAKARRATLDAARQAGLTARHRTKLARLAQAEATTDPDEPIPYQLTEGTTS